MNPSKFLRGFYMKQSKNLVNALLECVDLVKNGYNVIVTHCSDSVFYMKLRHYRNCRNLTVLVNDDGAYLLEDGTTLKMLI